MKTKTLIAAGALALAALAGGAMAEPFDDGQSTTYYDSLKGKKVGFVPLSMGFDLTEGWNAGLQNQAKALGYEVMVRDPNWNTEAGAQAANGFIAEKPDVLILHPLDMQAYNRIVQKAMAAGINVIQVNLKSVTNGDAYVGTDWYEMGVKQAEAVVAACGEGSGKNGKIAFVQGMLATPTATISGQGAQDVFDKHPEIEVVATQAADWDASKAQAITSTILKQHPDLCAITGFWDVMDVGTAAAIKESGKDVYLLTQGGGNQSACDGIENGTYDEVVVYHVPGQARDMADMIKQLIQVQPEPGATKTTLFTPLQFLTKESMKPGSCWSLPGQ